MIFEVGQPWEASFNETQCPSPDLKGIPKYCKLVTPQNSCSLYELSMNSIQILSCKIMPSCVSPSLEQKCVAFYTSDRIELYERFPPRKEKVTPKPIDPNQYNSHQHKYVQFFDPREFQFRPEKFVKAIANPNADQRTSEYLNEWKEKFKIYRNNGLNNPIIKPVHLSI